MNTTRQQVKSNEFVICSKCNGLKIIKWYKIIFGVEMLVDITFFKSKRKMNKCLYGNGYQTIK